MSRRRVTGGRATPPLVLDRERRRRAVREHLVVAAVGAVLALGCAVYVGGTVLVFQRLTPCERHLEAWEQHPDGCRSPWRDSGGGDRGGVQAR